MFSVSHKKITVLFRYRFHFLSRKHKHHSQQHYLFPFTTLIIPTFYHFLTFRLQILENCNNKDSITSSFIPLFSIYLSKRTSQKQQKQSFIQNKHNNNRLYASRYKYKEKEEVRDEEERGRLQKSTRMISDRKNKEIQNDLPKEPRRLMYQQPQSHSLVTL